VTSLRAELPPTSFGLGTAGFAFGDVAEADAVDTIVDAAGAGVRLIDTARAYARFGEDATAERLVGRALARGAGVDTLVATKGGHWRDGDEFPIDGRAATIRAHCGASLRALGVPQIDLYFLHHADPSVALEESVRALNELRREGLVRHIGLSNVTLDDLDRASRVAPIAAVQNSLSLTRPKDLDVARACLRREVVFLAYSPLGGVGAATPAAATRIASRRGVSPAQVQLAWLLRVAPGIVPIVGATRPATVRDSLRARDLHLSSDELAELDDSAVPGKDGPQQ